jgi:predicted nuclease with TOPRIM domain
MAEDEHTFERIQELVSEEKQLRDKLSRGEIDPSEEHQRLRAIETQLDQCWDLLRQRRALRETGGDPGQAEVRPPDEVEGYLN